MNSHLKKGKSKMKKSILLALAFASTAAFASKARLSALQGADHIVDPQTVFMYPSHINKLSPYITFEFGAAGTDAEGGIVRSLANGDKLLFYMGHKQGTSLGGTTTDLRTAGGYIGQVNPIEVIYGTQGAAYGLSLSTVDNKKSGTKESTAILKYGLDIDALTLFANVTALSTAEKVAGVNTDKLNSAPRVTIGANTASGDFHYFGSLTFGEAKNTVATVDTKTKDLRINLGLEDRSLKTAESDIYFGGNINYATRDIEGKKITETSLPVFVGIEHTITSWAKFRGSVAQNLLVGSSKDETAVNTDADGIPSNTTASAGLGFNYGKLQLDGSLTAGTNGQVNGSSFLTQSSVTYSF
jgi:hypothetical protein